MKFQIDKSALLSVIGNGKRPKSLCRSGLTHRNSFQPPQQRPSSSTL